MKKIILLSIVFIIGISNFAYCSELPFYGTDTWKLCQGYNTYVPSSPKLDHNSSGVGVYAFDFVIDKNALTGTNGCLFDDSANVGLSAGKSIYAPANGKVRFLVNGDIICLQLEKPHGLIKSINFGHMVNKNEPENVFNKSVIAGQWLGNLKSGYAHLHISAFKTNDCSGINIDGRDQTTPFDDFFTGYSFPSVLADGKTTEKTKNYRGKKINPPIIPPSTIDGAGSLIDPSKGGNCGISDVGCSTDIVRLHPHPLLSSAIFQIYSDSNNCKYVTLESNKDFSSYYITSKLFYEQYPGASGSQPGSKSSIYKAINLPINLELNPGQFYNVVVTTAVPVPSFTTQDITATCKSDKFIASPSSQFFEIAPSIDQRSSLISSLQINTGLDAVIAGQGSLIPFSGIKKVDFGRIKDEAITISGNSSVALFQIYTDNKICKSIYLADSKRVSAGISLKLKKWDEATWQYPQSVTLPITIDIPSKGYWILEVRNTVPNTVTKFTLNCV